MSSHMSSSGCVEDEDVFSWMFMNPELFPSRSFLPGLPAQPSELQIDSHSEALLGVQQEVVDQCAPLAEPHLSYEEEPDYESDGSSVRGNSVGEKRNSSSNLTSRAKRARPSNTSEDGADNDDSRSKRLEKNREIARNCRKRKREKMESLEEEVQKLRDWNRQLELKLKQIPENGAKEEVRKREVAEIASLISTESTSTEDEVRKKLHQYKEVYSDFGRDRKQAINFHLEQLKTLLLPNQVSKMTIWSLQQEDDFYDEQRNKTTFGGGIWNLICDELELSEEQKRTLLGMRSEIRGQRRNVGECLRILKELEKRIGENIQSMGKQMAKIMSATTPSQQAKFLLWIEQNQAAVQVLNNIWEQRREIKREKAASGHELE